jgi:hypothetical protein
MGVMAQTILWTATFRVEFWLVEIEQRHARFGQSQDVVDCLTPTSKEFDCI